MLPSDEERREIIIAQVVSKFGADAFVFVDQQVSDAHDTDARSIWIAIWERLIDRESYQSPDSGLSDVTGAGRTASD